MDPIPKFHIDLERLIAIFLTLLPGSKIKAASMLPQSGHKNSLVKKITS